MSFVMTSPPAIEPVTLAEAKAHLRVDGSSDDVLIGSLQLTSRLHLETALSLAMITQSWRLQLDAWPANGIVEIDLSPVQSINEVRVRVASGSTVIVPASSYVADLATRPARLVIKDVTALQAPAPRVAGIEIDLTAGFGATAAAVPAPLKHALLMLTAHWYEHRDPFEVGSEAARIPSAISELIQPFRKIRL